MPIYFDRIHRDMITLDTLSSIADAMEEAISLISCSTVKGEKVCMGADGTPTSRIDKVAENAALMHIQREGIPLNILSEEIGFVDNGGEEVLVMDPIDGTSNAIAGVPYYTISLAVGRDNTSNTRLAYMRNPATGDVYTAERGKGAFKNGCPIHVREPVMDDLFMMIYIGKGCHQDSFDLVRRVRSCRSFGCASLEMAIVAEGEADGSYLHTISDARSIRVVDIAASTLILREAGGEVYNLDGSLFDMLYDLEHRSNFLAVPCRSVFDYVMVKGDRPAPRRFGIYTNTSVSKAVDYTEEVIDALGDCEYVLDSGIAEVMGVPGTPLNEMDVEVVIVIGGDGTLLRAMQNTDAPVIGVNGGSVGFLAEIDKNDIASGIARLRSGDYNMDSRFKISTWYDGMYLPDSVNEVVVHTDTVAKIRHYRIYVDDILAADFRADGIVVSTPTGSTCYAMSLGAPYMAPNVEALLIVPMAPYKYNSRPFVVPATSKVVIENVMDKGCMIVLDGQEETEMRGCSKVEFLMSDSRARLIRFDSDFYCRVRRKLVNGE